MLTSYWAATSSNGLINRMIQTASSEIKTGMETLLNGGQIEACFDEPERFYHGFILGLIVEQWENYRIRSNRESGFGRYDVMMIPRERSGKHLPAIVMEFKVHNSRKEQTLEETVQAALQQIEDKHYDDELLAQGFKKAQIHHYGLAFQGKKS